MFGGFLLGCLTGVVVGVFTMVILYINRDDNDK